MNGFHVHCKTFAHGTEDSQAPKFVWLCPLLPLSPGNPHNNDFPILLLQEQIALSSRSISYWQCQDWRSPDWGRVNDTALEVLTQSPSNRGTMEGICSKPPALRRKPRQTWEYRTDTVDKRTTQNWFSLWRTSFWPQKLQQLLQEKCWKLKPCMEPLQRVTGNLKQWCGVGE